MIRNCRKWVDVPRMDRPFIEDQPMPAAYHGDDWLWLASHLFYMPQCLVNVALIRYAEIYRAGPSGPVIPAGTKSGRTKANLYILDIAEMVENK